MSALAQLPIKTGNDLVPNETLKALKAWDDRLVFPLSKLPERYAWGELQVLVELDSNRLGHRPGLRVCIAHSVCQQLWRKLPFDAVIHDDEFPMFVESVHVVDDRKWVIQRLPSVVGLQFLDHRECRDAPNAVYFSVVSGDFVFIPGLFDKDGKFYPVGKALSVCGSGKMPDYMVKAGAEVVNNLPGENRKSWRDRFGLESPQGRNFSLHGFIGPDSVFVRLEKPRNFPVKINDVLIGPF